MEDHLEYVRKVTSHLIEVGLKLNPLKYKLVHCEVEYLGDVINSDRLQQNSRLVSAVHDFPKLKNILDTHRFLGLATYYRKFIAVFAKITPPLHELTCK